MQFLVKYGFLFYILMLVVLATGVMLYDFSFTYLIITVLFLIIYYMISGVGFYSLYKMPLQSKWHYTGLLLMLIVLIGFIFIIESIYLAVPILVVIPMLYKKRYNLLYGLLNGLLLLLFVGFLFMAIFIRGISFYSTTTVETYVTPDSNYQISMSYIDQGALGGEHVAYLEKTYIGMLIVKKRVYLGKLQPHIEWLNSKEFSVNQTHYFVNMLP